MSNYLKFSEELYKRGVIDINTYKEAKGKVSKKWLYYLLYYHY